MLAASFIGVASGIIVTNINKKPVMTAEQFQAKWEAAMLESYKTQVAERHRRIAAGETSDLFSLQMSIWLSAPPDRKEAEKIFLDGYQEMWIDALVKEAFRQDQLHLPEK